MFEDFDSVLPSVAKLLCDLFAYPLVSSFFLPDIQILYVLDLCFKVRGVTRGFQHSLYDSTHFLPYVIVRLDVRIPKLEADALVVCFSLAFDST